MVDDSFDYFQSDTSQHTTHDNYIGIKYKFEAQRTLIFPYTVHHQKKCEYTYRAIQTVQ